MLSPQVKGKSDLNVFHPKNTHTKERLKWARNLHGLWDRGQRLQNQPNYRKFAQIKKILANLLFQLLKLV